MRLLPSDPDIETIISRIADEDLNLQPDFQRGEVWSKGKKQRLIDSILRDWHVPPIHVVENQDTGYQEVLDGQQRLVAIRDFCDNRFAIDGLIEPVSDRILSLDGKLYRDLPPGVRKQFDRFTIRVFRIVDYGTAEPAELFYRLNQPTNLTSAEQRNAYYGPVREQIRKIAEGLEGIGLNKDFLGFSNSRMAYDDVLSRAAITIGRENIEEKIVSSDLVEIYRGNLPLSKQTETSLRNALDVLGQASRLNRDHPRFNKATFYSWIIFVVRSLAVGYGPPISADELADFLAFFNNRRLLLSTNEGGPRTIGNFKIEWLAAVYDDRSTSRVADVSSVILRDITSWLIFLYYRVNFRGVKFEQVSPKLITIAFLAPGSDREGLAKLALDHGWGRLS